MYEAFTQAKQMISQEVFLTYPDWTTPFYVHTDASDKQLGAAITQVPQGRTESQHCKM